MKFFYHFAVVAAVCSLSSVLCKTTCDGPEIPDIATIRTWLFDVNKTMTTDTYDAVEAEWNWATDITDQHEKEKAAVNAKMAETYKNLWKDVACFNCEAAGCTDEEKRRISYYESIGTSALPAQAFADYGEVQTVMENIYSTGKVCMPDNSRCLALDPDLTALMLESDDYCELQWAWEGWRNETGRKMRGYYTAYTLLQNQAAEINGFDSAKDMWTAGYLADEPTFYEQIEAAWQEVLPLYRQLHLFALTKLKQKYGSHNFDIAGGHIPAHLLGNMWAQDWNVLYPMVVPFPDAPTVDITQLLADKDWTEMDLFYESDRFFQSIGLGAMTNDFWNNSVFLRKPPPTEMVCHASAWDFYRLTDFRVKMCTVVTSGDFQTVHHEMGHIQYYMQYKDQYVEFRNGANSGFHEAIGDLIALSVMTPGHLKTIGLLPSDFIESNETSMNALMSMALQKVAFLPFGYLMDKYRWDIFARETPFSEMNDAWWKLRCEMQGVSPPVPRSEEDFDAGSKYHTPASVPYIRYFFAHIAQFQFHRAICEEMGYTEDFHKCDIYNDTVATEKFRKAMSYGSSKPYPEVMYELTGSRNLSATALLDYFKPLYNWLIEQNTGNSDTWSAECPTIVRNDCNYNYMVTTPAPPITEHTTEGAAKTLHAPSLLLATMLAGVCAILKL